MRSVSSTPSSSSWKGSTSAGPSSSISDDRELDVARRERRVARAPRCAARARRARARPPRGGADARPRARPARARGRSRAGRRPSGRAGRRRSARRGRGGGRPSPTASTCARHRPPAARRSPCPGSSSVLRLDHQLLEDGGDEPARAVPRRRRGAPRGAPIRPGR